jgi:thiamine transporter ThiT
MKFVRYFFQVIIGVLFGALAALALSPFFASFAEGSGVPYLILAAVIIAVIIALASNIRRCFG